MKFKRLKCWLLVCIMLVAIITPIQSSAAVKFTDIKGHWAESYIITAVNQGFINGYPDGTFLPDKAITRAEFITMVNKALGINGSITINYNDVPYYEWYYNAISKAVAANYVAGYDDNSFKPNIPISRQEAAVMISRFVPTYGSSGNLRSYLDYSSIADWAYEALAKVNGKGYIGAYNDRKIHPSDGLTRAQSAKIICDIIDKETIVTSDPIVKTDGTKLSGRIYANNVTIHKDLEDDDATIDNCVILGNLYVQGGGTDTVTINNSRVSSVSIDKSASSVRLLAKGETAISKLTASRTSILQTSSLAGGRFGPGFSNINISSSANVTLRGSFPLVNLNGSAADVTLESGSISALNVDSTGKNSDITVSDGAAVSNATVNAQSRFHGTGTISHMGVNANGITYEKKPRNWTIASRVDAPVQADPELDITFSPKNGDTKVYLDAKITITFSTAMTKYNGNSISSSDIEDFIKLRKSSKSGSSVGYSASINSAKKIITITPDSNLSENTKYYVIIEEDSMKDSNRNGNDEKTIYFTTGTNTASLTTTFSPANGATTIPVNPTITVSFSDSVIRYSNGATISTSDSYLKECIVFKQTSSSGSDVSYSASINSTKKTITITPNSNLSLNQKYYIAIVSNKLKTSGGTTVPSSSVTWTTGYTTPVLNSFSLSPGDTSITATMTPNVAGKVYAVVLPSGSTGPSASQIAAGQNNSGAPALAAAKNENVAAGSAVSLPALIGLGSGVTYDIWATLYSTTSGTFSTPVKESTTTTLPRIYLSDLTVMPVVNALLAEDQIDFNDTDYRYDLDFNSDIKAVRISAVGKEEYSITINNTPCLTADIPVNGNLSVPVVVSKEGNTSSTYTININVTDNASLKALKIDGLSQSLVDSDFSYNLSTSGAIDINLGITANDKFAKINAPFGTGVIVNPNDSYVGSGNYTLSFESGINPVAIQFTVKSGTDSDNFTVTFSRPQPIEGS